MKTAGRRPVEGCPTSTTGRLGIDFWQTSYAGNAVTVCTAWDGEERVAVVQIVNFDAGAKMRVMSEAFDDPPLGTTETRFKKRTSQEWHEWIQSSVATPPAAQLFSVTNGSFFMCSDGFEGCTLADIGSGASSRLSFPEKKWNAITSLGAETWCYDMTPAEPHGKRVFALSDPRGTGKQSAFIDTFNDNCQSTWASASAELSSFQGQPANFFDATVGLHPTYGPDSTVDCLVGCQDGHCPDVCDLRTFVATRHTQRRWTAPQNRAYLFTSERPMKNADARSILAEDFGTMYAMQLDSGGSTQFYAEGPGYVDSLHDPAWTRIVPEVLVVYDAP